MLSNMASSLIKHKRITTTLAKAKALRKYVEPIITKSKNDTTHSRRVVFSYLKDKESVSILFREISEKVAARPGGYTRIIKLENRLGDNAEMAFIELVDYNEVYTKGAPAEKKTTRRRGRKKSGAAASVEAAAEESTQEVEATVEAEEVAAPTQEEPTAEAEVAAPAEEESQKTDETPSEEEPKKED